jgi:hypothetical protein
MQIRILVFTSILIYGPYFYVLTGIGLCVGGKGYGLFLDLPFALPL